MGIPKAKVGKNAKLMASHFIFDTFLKVTPFNCPYFGKRNSTRVPILQSGALGFKSEIMSLASGEKSLRRSAVLSIPIDVLPIIALLS